MRYFLHMNLAARIVAPLALCALLLVPALALAEDTTQNPYGGKFTSTNKVPNAANTVAPASNNIVGVANTIIFLINDVAVPVLFAIAFIVFLYGVFKSYIWSRGDETAVEEGHKLILWGLIGFAVMISLWGIVNVVSATFGIRSDIVPSWPRSYY